MNTVTISPKYQVVIPKPVRERMSLLPGEKVEIISFDDRIELLPVRPMAELKGFLHGLDPSFEREKGDRA